MKNKAFIAVLALVFGLLGAFGFATKNTEAYSSCTINSFYASPNNIAVGGSTTLMLSTTGCQNLVISGGAYSNYSVGYGTTMYVGPLYTNTTYTVTGADSYGNLANSSTTVTVGTSGGYGSCVINSFTASPSVVYSGQSSSLIWNTNGCSYVTVTGPGVNSSATSNTFSVGSIYNTSTYTIVAGAISGGTTTQSVTISVNGTNGGTGTAGFATTLPATNITSNGATLNGSISVNNCYNSYNCTTTSSYYFLYGTTQYSLGNSTGTQTTTYGSGTVSQILNGLLPNTTYYYQLVSTGTNGTNYGSVLSFFTNNSVTPIYNSQTLATTSIATNITNYSAQLNGVAVTSVAGGTTYFEYGTSPSFGLKTSEQGILVGSANNYYTVISVSPNTLYYYRIDAKVNGQVYYGDTATFSTTNSGTYYPPADTTYTTPRIGVGSGTSYTSLTITNNMQAVTAGNNINYTVNYQNISSKNLTGAVLNVILPKNVTFHSATQGVLTTNNSVAVNLGLLAPGQSGTIYITATATTEITDANNMVAQAILAFTIPGGAQNSAIAYSINNFAPLYGNNNNLGGLALFGVGFFPNSLIGWVLIIVILLVIIFIIRYFILTSTPKKSAETHVYYKSAPQNPHMGEMQPDKYGDPMHH